MSLSKRRATGPCDTAIARSISENGVPTQKARGQGLSKQNRVATTGKPSLNTQPRCPISALSNGTLLGRVLGNGLQANRSASAPVLTATDAARGMDPRKKPSARTSFEDFDTEGNKENVAPFRVVSLTTPPETQRRRAGGSAEADTQRKAVRVYSDSLALADAFGAMSIKSPRLHVVSLVEDSDGSESDSQDECKGGGIRAGTVKRALSGSPLASTKTVSSLEVQGEENVVFTISQEAMRSRESVSSEESLEAEETTTDSGDSDSEESEQSLCGSQDSITDSESELEIHVTESLDL